MRSAVGPGGSSSRPPAEPSPGGIMLIQLPDPGAPASIAVPPQTPMVSTRKALKPGRISQSGPPEPGCRSRRGGGRGLQQAAARVQIIELAVLAPGQEGA